MAVERRATSRHWYCRFAVGGKRIMVRLEARVAGAPGSREFLDSMAAARAEERVLLNRAAKGDADFHRKLAEAMAPDPVFKAKRDFPLSELGERWGKTQKPGAMGLRWRALCVRRLGRFGAWAGKQGVPMASQASRGLAQGYLGHVRGQGASPATYNATLGLLHRAFRALGPGAGLKVNPFEGLERMPGHVVNRVPFTREEIDRLLKACPREIAGPVATAVCTGLRRGDACRLEWRCVDLAAGFLRGVRVMKTGARVDVPLLPLLRRSIEEAQRSQVGIQDSGFRIQNGGQGKYVWPVAARMARENPNGLNWRMNLALKAAKLAGKEDRRGAGMRAANVRGWHGLKTTFVTEALNHGFPIELLRKLVGNSAVDVVREHYYRPDGALIAEEMRKAMGKFGE